MNLQYADVFPLLAGALSDFRPSHEDWIGPAPYFFLGDMISFVCQKAGSGSLVEVDQLSALLEKLALEGDDDVQDLLLDSLEGLRECDLKDVVAERFGPIVKSLWNAIS